MLADVRRGIWRESEPPPIVEEAKEQTFHEFASEWLEIRKREGLAARTVECYEWALSHHLLPFFAEYRLSEITAREIDIYKTAKMANADLSPNSINGTITRLWALACASPRRSTWSGATSTSPRAC
ncbi:MAG: hypothetical protein ABI896_03725 [Actinomycetota bacterium]